MLEKLRQGLQRTRERLTRGLGQATAGPAPDWEQMEEALLGADVGLTATEEILDAVRSAPEEDLREALERRVAAILERARADRRPPSRMPGQPEVVMVVGVNGTGKTTTVAKLAHRSAREGKRPLVVAADTFRAAAVEQLETWARRAASEIAKGPEGADAAAVVHDALQMALARGLDPVIVDTAGRLHTKRPLMDELAKVKRIAGRVVEGAPHQTLLVMDATVGANGLAQARQFADAVGLDGIVLTKLDGTAKGGVVVAVARELGIPVLYVGVGEKLDDLVVFEANEFASALL